MTQQPSSPSDVPVAFITGGCHCGAISYQFPLPPVIDLEGPDVSDRYKRDVIPPSKQRFPARGGRPQQNKWRANHCHCSACRRTVGGLMVDWVGAATQEISVTKTGPVGLYRSSNHGQREFCKTCGTSLFFLEDDDPEFLDITIGSITTPNLFDFIEFTDHTWIEDALPMVLDEQGKGGGLAGVLNDDLPKFMTDRSSKQF